LEFLVVLLESFARGFLQAQLYDTSDWRGRLPACLLPTFLLPWRALFLPGEKMQRLCFMSEFMKEIFSKVLGRIKMKP
jgi:hypothetical protein